MTDFRRGGAVLALGLLAACGGAGEAEAPATPLPDGVSALAADARLALPAGDDRACKPASVRKVFRQAREWEDYWLFGLPAHCPQPQLPAEFDWARDNVVFVTMGRRGSPADSIMVQGAGVVGDSLRVVVRRTTRQDGCEEAEVQSWPSDLVRIPAGTQPARFMEQHVKLPCTAP